MDEEKWQAEQAGPGSICEFRVGSFKSYRKATLKLRPLTLLIGPNASGKSNLVEGLRLLSWLGSARRVDEALRSPVNGESGLRGGVRDLPLDGEEQFTLGCRFGVLATTPWTEYSVTIGVSGETPRVELESLRSFSEDRVLFELSAEGRGEGHEARVNYYDFGQRGRAAEAACDDRQLILTQLRTPASFDHSHPEAQRRIPKIAEALSARLSGIRFLEPDPGAMRGYSPRQDTELQENGANLASTLFELCETRGQKGDVLEFIRPLPEDDIADIGFIETELDDVMLHVTESFGGRHRRRGARIISDGTLRVLAIAAGVLSVREGSLVVIEEVDSGVHPSRARALTEAIRRVAMERNLSVLLTSHNPALLDALPIEAIPDVACCYRDPKTGWSRLVRLGDSDRYAELVAQGTVGRLMTHGIIERILRDTRTSEERKADALHWIEERRRKFS